jgi:hypothetical protein
MPRTPKTEKLIAERTANLTSRLDECIGEGAKVFTGPSVPFHHRTARLVEGLPDREAARRLKVARSTLQRWRAAARKTLVDPA